VFETTNSRTQASMHIVETTNSRTQASMHIVETTNSRTQASMHRNHDNIYRRENYFK
jgi:hypothetical protein